MGGEDRSIYQRTTNPTQPGLARGLVGLVFIEFALFFLYFGRNKVSKNR